MSQHEKINYVEFPCRELSKTKEFFIHAFGWSFVDYGPDYTAFSDAGIEGGFFQAAAASTTASGGALVVLYSKNLEDTYRKVRESGGHVLKEIFNFPGGRRFHFTEPSGNELAVWSDRSS